MCEKDYIWNHATCSCKYAKYLASIISDSVIACDEIIPAETNLYGKKQKQLQQILMKKMQSVKQAFLCFTWIFINYHCIIDSC